MYTDSLSTTCASKPWYLEGWRTQFRVVLRWSYRYTSCVRNSYVKLYVSRSKHSSGVVDLGAAFAVLCDPWRRLEGDPDPNDHWLIDARRLTRANELVLKVVQPVFVIISTIISWACFFFFFFPLGAFSQRCSWWWRALFIIFYFFDSWLVGIVPSQILSSHTRRQVPYVCLTS